MMVRMRRQLGAGHWDKKLVQRMTYLSEADNWEDAKHEWKATGEVWWSGNTDNMPDFVADSNQGYGKCLCGHKVVYHFEIINTENNTIECVGSDHIESFLIIRYLEEDMGIENATDEQIQEWIDNRMKTMKSEAWWHNNGEFFTTVLEQIREADLYYNYNRKWEWDIELEANELKPTKPIKRGKGELTDVDYQMASITWRWDDSRNPRNQKATRGYPNERLMQDLALFHGKFMVTLQADMKAREQRHQERKEELARLREQRAQEREAFMLRREERMARERRDRKLRLRATNANTCAYLSEEANPSFKKLAEFYDIPTFDSRYAKNQWELEFLRDMKVNLSSNKQLTDNQVSTLYRIVNNTEPATNKQLAYLMSLGYEGKEPTTKAEASRLITEYKEE